MAYFVSVAPIVMCIPVLLVVVTGATTSVLCKYYTRTDRQLYGNVYLTLYPGGEYRCQLTCLYSSRCVSFNWNPDLQMCQLCDSSEKLQPWNLRTRPGVVYGEPMKCQGTSHACTDRPCKDDEICMPAVRATQGICLSLDPLAVITAEQAESTFPAASSNSSTQSTVTDASSTMTTTTTPSSTIMSSATTPSSTITSTTTPSSTTTTSTTTPSSTTTTSTTTPSSTTKTSTTTPSSTTTTSTTTPTSTTTTSTTTPSSTITTSTTTPTSTITTSTTTPTSTTSTTTPSSTTSTTTPSSMTSTTTPSSATTSSTTIGTTTTTTTTKPPPTTTTAVSTTTGVSYSAEGCYSQSNSDRLLPTDDDISSNSMTIPMCSVHCRSLNKPYIALHKGKDCSCGSTLDTSGHTLLADSECDKACKGDSSMFCGATWKVSVFKNS